MVGDVANDFEVLEFSPATAGAVLDTLALLSGSQTSLTSESQVRSNCQLSWKGRYVNRTDVRAQCPVAGCRYAAKLRRH